MISFAETVLNVKPNKPEEENITPYTYEETVMCIYEYGECYRNLNKELALFSEADGTDNPGKIQRLMAWLRKMWEKFKAWFKRVFGFVNVKGEVEPEVAKLLLLDNKKETPINIETNKKVNVHELYKDTVEKIEQRLDVLRSTDDGTTSNRKVQCQELYNLILIALNDFKYIVQNTSAITTGYDVLRIRFTGTVGSDKFLPSKNLSFKEGFSPSIIANDTVRAIRDNKTDDEIKAIFFKGITCYEHDGSANIFGLKPVVDAGIADLVRIETDFSIAEFIEIVLKYAFGKSKDGLSDIRAYIHKGVISKQQIDPIPMLDDEVAVVKVAGMINALSTICETTNASASLSVIMDLIELLMIMSSAVLMDDVANNLKGRV